MAYQRKRAFKLKKYKRYSRRRGAKRTRTKRLAPRIARLPVTRDRTTISLVDWYYYTPGVVVDPQDPGHFLIGVDLAFNACADLTTASYFPNYVAQYSYALPNWFSFEYVPVALNYPSSGVFTLGPLEMTPTGSPVPANGYLQLKNSIMVVPNNNQTTKFKKTFPYQRLAMEYTTDGLANGNLNFGFVQLFQVAGYTNTIPPGQPFFYTPVPLTWGMIKVTHNVTFWENRGGPAPIPPTYYAPEPTNFSGGQGGGFNPHPYNLFGKGSPNPNDPRYKDPVYDTFIPVSVGLHGLADWHLQRQKFRKSKTTSTFPIPQPTTIGSKPTPDDFKSPTTKMFEEFDKL